MPKSGGVPTWRSRCGRRKADDETAQAIRAVFADSKPLDEATGRALATWAKGGAASNPVSGFPKKDEFWGGRRYWPAVRNFLDSTHAANVGSFLKRRSAA
jgi:hypothetical protein